MGKCEVENCTREATRELCPPHGKDVRLGRIPSKQHWFTQPNPKCNIDGCDRVSSAKKGNRPCHVHYCQFNSGKDPAQVRGKTENGGQKPMCSVEGCQMDSKAKGKCVNHYQNSKYQKVTSLCPEDGCKVRMRSGVETCARHRPKPEKPKPPVKICTTPRCGKDFRTWNDNLDQCGTHHRDMRAKGLSREQYQDVKQVNSCEVCGDTTNLVVDHKHGHHETKREMCPKCIRGVLCSPCNSALGYARENEETLRGLITYLEKHPPGEFFNPVLDS